MMQVNGPDAGEQERRRLAQRATQAEAEADRLRSIMLKQAHIAATLGSGAGWWVRGQFMSISNALNAGIGRTQSTHDEQYDERGNVVSK